MTGFGVGLSFNQIPSKLEIPFAAITAFVDPAVDFGLQFQATVDDMAPEAHDAAQNDGGTKGHGGAGDMRGNDDAAVGAAEGRIERGDGRFRQERTDAACGASRRHGKTHYRSGGGKADGDARAQATSRQDSRQAVRARPQHQSADQRADPRNRAAQRRAAWRANRWKRACSRGVTAPSVAKDAVDNRSMVSTLVSYGVTKVATRSVPGAVLVGGGLLAKTLFDRSQSRRAAKNAGDAAIRETARRRLIRSAGRRAVAGRWQALRRIATIRRRARCA